MVRKLSFIQGSYFFVTGIWPLLHLESFLFVTGDKHDIWLVNMVAALTISIGGFLLISAARNRIHAESLFLVMGATISYLLIDVIYATRGRISNIYLADALVELLFLLLWIFIAITKKSQIH